MTKKDFEAVARALKVSIADLKLNDDKATQLIDNMMYELRRLNPKFNNEIFLAACGRKLATQ